MGGEDVKYPRLLARINNFLGIFSGGLVLCIGLVAVYEALARTLFNSPTSWSLDVSRYVIIWAIFLGSSYSFQEKGHVGVDFVRDIISKHYGKTAVRAVTVTGYLVCLTVVGIFLYNGIEMCRTAIKLNSLTLANIQIPIVYLYSAIVIGSLCMMITILCIIASLLGGNDQYLG